MSDRQITWGLVRRIYLFFGVLAAIAALLSFVWPGIPGPFISTVVAVLILGVAIFASDALMDRVHRILWHREWPK